MASSRCSFALAFAPAKVMRNGTRQLPRRLAELHWRSLRQNIQHASHHRHYVSRAPEKPDYSSGNTYTQSADKLSQTVTGAEQLSYTQTSARATTHAQKQASSPWMRDDSARAPADRIGKAKKAFSGGKLLTTPSRMLKLVVPLGRGFGSSKQQRQKQNGQQQEQQREEKEEDEQENEQEQEDEEVEPLALLVHPQQPLSYLERLIQSELPPITDKESGKERLPGVWFRAPDARDSDGDGKDDPVGQTEREKEEQEGKTKEEEDGDDDKNGKKKHKSKTELKKQEEAAEKRQIERQEKQMEGSDVTIIDGQRVSSGKLKSKSKPQHSSAHPVSSPSMPEVTAEQAIDKNDPTAGFVRWSASTEIGDFIRDAARAKHFALDIESAPAPILVSVPSFKDRTYYLRMRLRQRSIEIARLADIKRECDKLAERGAKRVALAGGLALVVYWFVVYLCTFRTELGWDVMEPVTYLVGLSTLIGGYAWFLVHNRQVSYKSAMHFTVSRRQSKLYELKGFDLARWEEIIEEGNKLRREIKMIAEEYDVQWNEKDDAKSEKVIEALENERKKKESKKKDKDDDDDDD